VAFLSWRFGITQTTLWRIEVAPVRGLSNVATPTKAIITIATSINRYGNGDDAEEGGPREMCMGWSISHFLYPKGQTRRLQRRALSRLYSLCSCCFQLQRFSHHAHCVLVQPVQVGLLAQPCRRTRPGSLPLQHFLHYFSEEVPTGERGIRTSEKALSTHSGE
jgi:hypothetical protein